MHRMICGRVLLASACILASATAWGQKIQNAAKYEPVFIDLAVTYTPERAQVIPAQCCFWMQGGGVDASATFWKRLGIAASLTGDHASDVTSGVDVNKISYMGGPRYTYTALANHILLPLAS